MPTLTVGLMHLSHWRAELFLVFQVVRKQDCDVWGISLSVRDGTAVREPERIEFGKFCFRGNYQWLILSCVNLTLSIWIWQPGRPSLQSDLECITISKTWQAEVSNEPLLAVNFGRLLIHCSIHTLSLHITVIELTFCLICRLLSIYSFTARLTLDLHCQARGWSINIAWLQFRCSQGEKLQIMSVQRWGTTHIFSVVWSLRGRLGSCVHSIDLMLIGSISCWYSKV